MPNAYYPPVYGDQQFHCPNCGVYAHQSWLELKARAASGWAPTDMMVAECAHCEEYSYWHKETLVVPRVSPLAAPHPDLPEDCAEEFAEARAVFNDSPRSSAALLRLCIQKLMPHLEQSGTNLNDDIASLVANGLPATVQKALDICRVVGNSAVHPGTLDLNDTPEIARELFTMVNFIVQDRITHPKEIERLYAGLPKSARDAIDERDSKPGATGREGSA